MKELKNRQFYLTVGLVVLFGALFFLSYLFYALAQSRLPHLANFKGAPGYITSIAGTPKEPLDRPIGVSAENGLVYVANNDPGRVDIFRPNGKRRRSFFVVAKNVGSNIMALAASRSRDVYVTDLTNSTIKVYNEDGTYRSLFPRTEPGTPSKVVFKRPLNITRSGTRFYIIDEHKVRVFSMSGREVFSFGERGKGIGQLDFPYSVAVGKEKLYVSDANNARVQVFNKRGEPLGIFEDYPKGGMILPRGLAIDSMERVHVVDNMAGKILIYDKDGKFLTEYGDRAGSNAEEALIFPNNISINKEDGLIYISDTGNNRVAVFGI